MRVHLARLVPAVAVLLWSATAGTGCALRQSIRFHPAEGSRGTGLFEAGPLSRAQLAELDLERLDNAAEVFAVRVAPDEEPDSTLPALAGDYRLDGTRLWFEPRFALTAGVPYRASFRRADGSVMALVVSLEKEQYERTTVVEAVYPTSDTLPENLLKFYLHFSAPMSKGQAWDHIRLLDSVEEPVELPFLELDEELWDRGVRRLTVLIDPGRVKRGVLPLEEVGPSLTDGKRFALVIDSGWEDNHGMPLARAFRKEFTVGPPDRTPPDPARWTLEAPRAGTGAPLRVGLDEPLDHGLLHSAVGVEGPDGRGVDGVVVVEDGETTWLFRPAAPWAEGEHHLVIATTLEDLAGNSVGRPFEVDVSEPIEERVVIETVRRSFRLDRGVVE